MFLECRCLVTRENPSPFLMRKNLLNVTETLGLNVLINQILLWANHSLTSITMLIFCDFRVCVNKVRNLYPAVCYIVVPLNGPHW